LKYRIGVIWLAIILAVSILGTITACTSSPETFKWKMAASWTADNLAYSEGAAAICDRISKLSNGRLIIEPYPAGKLTDAFNVFDAVSRGQIEAGHSWPGYWGEKDPSFQLFSSIPNNMVQQEWPIWLYGPSNGNGLWRELYAKYNLIPFPGALSGPEFGYFTTRPLRTLDDFKGMRIRAVGMATEVLQELGAVPVVTQQGEIVEALKQGKIDGIEFGSPAQDWGIGFDYTITPYVTLPPWHQPSAMYEVIVNKDAWNKLPADLQSIFEAACKEVSLVDFPARVEGVNADYQQKYIQGGMQVFVLDAATMHRISEITDALADAKAAQNPFYAKVLQSQRDFKNSYRTWEKWSDPEVYSGQ
jgi:TRAP-type mannitol/chloroaromatic compound transport system substrate-binding protein